jgi:hypothetical protein
MRPVAAAKRMTDATENAVHQLKMPVNHFLPGKERWRFLKIEGVIEGFECVRSYLRLFSAKCGSEALDGFTCYLIHCVELAENA